MRFERMSLERKLQMAKGIIKRTREEESYPSSPEEILKRNPNTCFPETERLKRLLHEAQFYAGWGNRRRKAHRLLNKIIY